MSDPQESPSAFQKFAALGRPSSRPKGFDTLTDRVLGRSILMSAVLVFCGAALIAVSAQVVVPLWPVPSTGQLVGILLMGFTLGPVRGGLATIVYLLMGLFGLPVYSSGGSGWDVLSGSNAGYFVGFVVSAVIVGFFALRGWDRSFGRALLAALVASSVTYLFGVPWLAFVRGYGILEALQMGLFPLLLGAVSKAALVAFLMWCAWRGIHSLERKALEFQDPTDAAEVALIT